MPFVLDGEHGRVDICGGGVLNEIEFSVDRLRQRPKADVARSRQAGSFVRVHWPVKPADCYAGAGFGTSSLDRDDRRFLQVASDFTFLNPHLTLTVDWFGDGDDGRRRPTRRGRSGRRRARPRRTGTGPRISSGWSPPTSCHDQDNGRDTDGARVRLRVPGADLDRQAEAGARPRPACRGRRSRRSLNEPTTTSTSARSPALLEAMRRAREAGEAAGARA